MNLCIITPTIKSRALYLERCKHSITSQKLADEVQVIHAIKEGVNDFGGHRTRNELIEENWQKCDYFGFVDDDNILLPGAIWRLAHIDLTKKPISVVCRMLHMGPSLKDRDRQNITPNDLGDVRMGRVGSLNFWIKSEVAVKHKWRLNLYESDWYFFQDCITDGISPEKWKECLIDQLRVVWIQDILAMWCIEGI